MKRIAVLSPPSSPYAHDLLEGISSYARRHTNWWHFVIGDPFTNAMEIIEETNPEGIIATVPTAEVGRRLLSTGLPLVNCSGNVQEQPIATVRVNNYEIGQMAAEHFMSKGFTSFAYCGRPRRRPLVERGQGYEVALCEAGLTCEMLMKWPVPAGPDTEHWVSPTRLPEVLEWLEGLAKPVAMFVCDDTVAVHMVECCARLGIRIPDSLALLGVNNTRLICEMTRPTISSIALPAHQIGWEAAATLDRLLRGEGVERERLFSPVEVVTRESTDVAAVNDETLAEALRFIRDSIRKPIVVDDVVEHVAVSRRGLETRFRAVLKRTIHQEIQRARVERVRQLLRDTDWGMERVAELAGFGSRERMSVVFRQQSGETPAAYRRRFPRRV